MIHSNSTYLDSPNLGTPLYQGAGKFFCTYMYMYYQLELFPLALPCSPAGTAIMAALPEQLQGPSLLQLLLGQLTTDLLFLV